MKIHRYPVLGVNLLASRLTSCVLLALLFLLLCMPFGQTHAAVEIDGAGSTSIAAILKEWTAIYESNHPVKIHYSGGGSAEGIKRVTARAVDFAITDIGLTQSELSQDDLLQFPLLGFGITPVVNIPSIKSGELQLSGAVLADIFLGKITYWDAAAIQSLNPRLALPHLPIQVIHRKDGSGTSFAFTNYLSKVSEAWEQTLGIGSTLLWPTGLAETGNTGVAKKVAEIEGAIGYVEYLYAQRYELTSLRLQNKDGNFVSPNPNTFAQTFGQITWQRPSFYESLTNLPGANSWPIMAESYVLVHRTNNDFAQAKLTLDFFDWVYFDTMNENDGYLRISDPAVLKRIKNSWTKIVDNKGNGVLK